MLVFVLNNIFDNRYISLTSQDVFAPGPSFRISNSTWCHRSPLCHIWLLNLDILQGGRGGGGQALSLRCLVSWIKHLPPACWSTVIKSTFKQQLGCRFDIMDSMSFFFLYFDICKYICLDTSYHFSALSLLLKYYSLFFFQIILY